MTRFRQTHPARSRTELLKAPRLTLWAAINPGTYGQYRESLGADWVQDGWSLSTHSYKGTLVVDDFIFASK